MARQNIGIGSSANDGTGDTLREAGTKLNANFTELYETLGGPIGVSTITANGAVSTTAGYIICNKGSALALTLADGVAVGETKVFTNKGAGAATVTPANFAQGTSFALAQYDGCTVIWDGSNWYLIGNQGEITVA